MHADAAPVQPLAAPCVALFALLMPYKRAPRSQMDAAFSERRMEKSPDLSLISTRTPLFDPLKSNCLAWINPAGRAEPIGTHQSK